MIRVAQYLLRWTGEARYADYIERALYNGILVQQKPNTGVVAYFLPLQPEKSLGLRDARLLVLPRHFGSSPGNV